MSKVSKKKRDSIRSPEDEATRNELLALDAAWAEARAEANAAFRAEWAAKTEADKDRTYPSPDLRMGRKP